MIPEKYKELIEKIKTATYQKKIVWEKTSRADEFKCMIGSSMVTTDNWDSVTGINYVDFAIWNSNGVQVDNVQGEIGSAEYDVIMELYSAAKASYLKADETIADILEHLDGNASIQ